MENQENLFQERCHHPSWHICPLQRSSNNSLKRGKNLDYHIPRSQSGWPLNPQTKLACRPFFPWPRKDWHAFFALLLPITVHCCCHCYSLLLIIVIHCLLLLFISGFLCSPPPNNCSHCYSLLLWFIVIVIHCYCCCHCYSLLFLLLIAGLLCSAPPDNCPRESLRHLAFVLLTGFPHFSLLTGFPKDIFFLISSSHCNF